MLNAVASYFRSSFAVRNCAAGAPARRLGQEASRGANGETRGRAAAIWRGDVRGLGRPAAPQLYRDPSFALDIAGIAAGTGFALLMAIAILPAVYKNAFDPDKPILIQLCALFASGLGWQSLFQAGATAIQ